MHRIDSSTATPDNRFTEGNPTIPVPATTVTAAWFNSAQEELIAILAAVGITPDKANDAQVVDAIKALIIDMTPIASVGVNGLVNPDGVTIKIDATGKIYVVQADKYDVGEFYYFRHPTLKPGFAPLQGGLISGAYQGKNITEYPIWAYLQTAEGQLLCTTEAQWQAMTTATWATLADGSKVGWNGIGGAPFYVQDIGAGTLRMPDIRGMYAEAAGFDSLGVGGVHGDMSRRKTGTVGKILGSYPNGLYYSTVTGGAGVSANNDSTYMSYSDNARVEPTGNSNKPRAWGALACCYLGAPAT